MSRFGRIVLAGLASLATAVAVAPPATAATYYNLVNYKSNRCMSVENGGSTANGANIIQWSCNDGSEQLWYRVGDQLKNRKSGKCLSVSGGGSTANGAELIQWSCNDGAEQRWTPSDGYLVNHKSGKVASTSGGSTANGAKVIQWSANGGGEQGWQFVARVIDA
ncbi:RICIN domain-containing protein [Lentzea sp. NPDC054927]